MLPLRPLFLIQIVARFSSRLSRYSCQAADQRHLAGDAVKLLAQAGRRSDNDGFHRQHGLGAPLDGGVARDLEVADHLDSAGAGFRQGRGLAAQHGPGGAFGVERVALTLLMPQLAVTNLEDLVGYLLAGSVS